MNQQSKSINDLSVEELEKIELQLWRQREQASATLAQCNNDLQIITNEIASRQNASNTVKEPLEEFNLQTP